MLKKKTPETLRSHRWFGVDDKRAFGHRSRIKQMGYGDEDYAGKPVIGIINTWSDMNTCHSHFRDRANEVKRGVWQSGGFPVEMPAMSLGEQMMKPTTMLYRNLLAMETEELIRSNPVDGVVLLGGCDKTVPALLMGAASANVPAIFLPAGPMLSGHWRGQTLGSGSDTWKYWDERRAGNISKATWMEMENGIARSAGTCMTMGTAATLAAAAEGLGMILPGASSIPSVDASHARLATDCGRRIVDMVWEDLKPSDIMTTEAFENAVTLAMCLGGSTNSIIHLIAMARRVGDGSVAKLDLDRFDALSRRTPLLGNLRPSGKYLMEDFYYAGGIRALMNRIPDLLNLDCITVSGKTVRENIEGAQSYQDDVILPRDKPLQAEGGLAVLRGNLCPDGAVIKHSAAEPHLRQHRGRAVVFENIRDMDARIDDPDLPVTKDSVIVMKNGGPLGGPGMPEWGQLPIPKKLLKEGVRDMVRISDSRMSGTSYGACVLHVAPESFVGGPLAFVQDGDEIELDVANRKLTLHVSDAELAKRRAAWKQPEPHYVRGYGQMFTQNVQQANEGCDFEFLAANRGPTPEPEIH